MTQFKLHDQGHDATSHRFSLHRDEGLPVLLDIGVTPPDRKAERALAQKIVTALNAYEPMRFELDAIAQDLQSFLDSGECPNSEWLEENLLSIRAIVAEPEEASS